MCALPTPRPGDVGVNRSQAIDDTAMRDSKDTGEDAEIDPWRERDKALEELRLRGEHSRDTKPCFEDDDDASHPEDGRLLGGMHTENDEALERLSIMASTDVSEAASTAIISHSIPPPQVTQSSDSTPSSSTLSAVELKHNGHESTTRRSTRRQFNPLQSRLLLLWLLLFML